MTGFIPPADPRYKDNGFVMLSVKGKDLPCSIREMEASDPESDKGTHRIECRSTAMQKGDVLSVAQVGEYVVVETYDPYKSNPDRSMKGRFIGAICTKRGE